MTFFSLLSLGYKVLVVIVSLGFFLVFPAKMETF